MSTSCLRLQSELINYYTLKSRYSSSKAVIIYPAEAMTTAAGEELERNIGAADRRLGIESKKRNILGSWLHRTPNANLERQIDG